MGVEGGGYKHQTRLLHRPPAHCGSRDLVVPSQPLHLDTSISPTFLRVEFDFNLPPPTPPRRQNVNSHFIAEETRAPERRFDNLPNAATNEGLGWHSNSEPSDH